MLLKIFLPFSEKQYLACVQCTKSLTLDRNRRENHKIVIFR